MHNYISYRQCVGQDGKEMRFATAQRKDCARGTAATIFLRTMLTGKMVDIEALRKQGVRRIIFGALESDLDLPFSMSRR